MNKPSLQQLLADVCSVVTLCFVWPRDLAHRLLRAWSFQSKLGVISNTIILAAPQLAHLMFVIFNAIALFALLSYVGLGQRVSYASGYAESFEETFRALLGLGYVGFGDNFPPEVRAKRNSVTGCFHANWTIHNTFKVTYCARCLTQSLVSSLAVLPSTVCLAHIVQS